jgi:tRNA dimethylallyltransferase
MRDEATRKFEAILIAGPTASGKSALALRLAQRIGGRIINADSMQVYQDLAVLTARPCPEAMASAPHALYGTVDGAQTYSVSRWLADARAEISAAKRDGLVPILVGGTGLYFKALTQGLSEIPPVPPKVRAALRYWAQDRAAPDLHAELSRRDPETAARLRPTDAQRILRAIEVHEATGESLAIFQARRAPPVLDPAHVLAVSLTLDRAVLRPRIDRRFDAMVEAGALEEVARLGARGLDPDLPVMRAIGVPTLLRHLAGELTLPAAVEAAKLASRQYIKRQETFMRHQLPTFRPIPADAPVASVLGQLSL